MCMMNIPQLQHQLGFEQWGEVMIQVRTVKSYVSHISYHAKTCLAEYIKSGVHRLRDLISRRRGGGSFRNTSLRPYAKSLRTVECIRWPSFDKLSLV